MSSRAAGKASVAKIPNPFLWVSEVTLGSFGRNFDAFPGKLHCKRMFSHPGALF